MSDPVLPRPDFPALPIVHFDPASFIQPTQETHVTDTPDPLPLEPKTKRTVKNPRCAPQVYRYMKAHPWEDIYPRTIDEALGLELYANGSSPAGQALAAMARGDYKGITGIVRAEYHGWYRYEPPGQPRPQVLPQPAAVQPPAPITPEPAPAPPQAPTAPEAEYLMLKVLAKLPDGTLIALDEDTGTPWYLSDRPHA